MDTTAITGSVMGFVTGSIVRAPGLQPLRPLQSFLPAHSCLATLAQPRGDLAQYTTHPFPATELSLPNIRTR